MVTEKPVRDRLKFTVATAELSNASAVGGGLGGGGLGGGGLGGGGLGGGGLGGGGLKEYWKPRVPLQACVLNDAHSWRTYHVRLYEFAGQLGSTLLLSVPRSAQPPHAWFRLKVLSPYAMAVTAAAAVAFARSVYTVSAVWPVHTALGTPDRLQVVSVVPMPWNTGTAQIWNRVAPGPVNWNGWHVYAGSGGLGGGGVGGRGGAGLGGGGGGKGGGAAAWVLKASVALHCAFVWHVSRTNRLMLALWAL